LHIPVIQWIIDALINNNEFESACSAGRKKKETWDADMMKGKNSVVIVKSKTIKLFLFIEIKLEYNEIKYK